MSSQTSSSKSSKSKAKQPRSSQDSTPLFTPRMQDAQARNKDSYASSSEDSPWEGAGRRFDAYGNDSYTNTQLRRAAAVILDNPELLMMHAQARNDSITGTRHHFTKQLCGYLNEKETSLPLEKAQEKPKQKLNKGKGTNNF